MTGLNSLSFAPLTVGLLLFATPALFLSAQEAPPASASFSALSEHFEPLRSRFNEDAGKVRLLLIIDPI